MPVVSFQLFSSNGNEQRAPISDNKTRTEVVDIKYIPCAQDSSCTLLFRVLSNSGAHISN